MVTVETVTMSTAPLLIALISETVLPVVNDLPQSLAHLCAGLSARGHQLQLVRPRQAEDQDRHSDERLLLTRGWMLPGLPGWQWGVSLQAKLQRHWRRKRPDVLYIATAGPLGLAALRAGRQLGIPVVSSLTEQVQALTHGHSLSPFYRLFDHYLRWFHNRSQLTLVPTSSQLQTLQRRGFEHLQLLTSGVDSQLFHPRQRDNALRTRWGLNDGDIAVLHRGRPNQLLARSWNALRSRYPQRRLKLLLLDDGPHDTAPGALVDSLQVEAADAASLATLMASTDLLLQAQPGAVADGMVLQALASGLGYAVWYTALRGLTMTSAASVQLSVPVLAALAGMIVAARLNSSTPKAGVGFELDVIAAVFIGGASMTGGSGKIIGVVVGALIMGVMNNGMSILGIGIDYQQVIKGLVLLAAVIFDVYNKNK